MVPLLTRSANHRKTAACRCADTNTTTRCRCLRPPVPAIVPNTSYRSCRTRAAARFFRSRTNAAPHPLRASQHTVFPSPRGNGEKVPKADEGQSLANPCRSPALQPLAPIPGSMTDAQQLDELLQHTHERGVGKDSPQRHWPSAASPLSRARAATVRCASAELLCMSFAHSVSAAVCIARP